MPILQNARWERFAQELAKGKSATQAYIEAGYEPNRHNAARLNTNEHIADRVKEILKAGAERAEVTVERVVREWARIGFADIRNAVNWHALTTELAEADEDGTPKTQTVNEVALVGSDEIDFDTARAIAEISQTKEGALKVKFHDKKGALDSIARHLGMFVDKTEIHHTHGDLSDADLDARLAAAATAAGLAGDPETTH